MIPFIATEALLTDHHRALQADAARRRLVREAQRSRRYAQPPFVSPARAFAARVLVRTGLRLAGADHARPATVSQQARPRSDGATVTIDAGAPVAPRRRAA